MTDRPAGGGRDFDRLSDLIPADGPRPARPPSRPPAGKPAADSSSDAHGRPACEPVSALAASASAADELSRRLAAVWEDVVGAEAAKNARPVQLRAGRLVVTTSSSAWAQTLQMMSPVILAGLEERLGEGSVERAVFRHAGWDVFAPLDGRAAKGAGAAGKGRPARDRGLALPRPGPETPVAASVPPPAAKDPTVVETAAPAGVPGGPAPAPPSAFPADGAEGFSAEEKQALADLDGLPLAPSVKQTIRDAMKAGFARAKQDCGRS